MNTAANHDMADDMAEFGAELNAGRVGRLTGAELNRAIADRAAPAAWNPRRCNGLDYQGRYPQAAECCTEIGADGVPSKWESADKEVALILAKAFGAMSALVFTIWMFQP